VVREEGAALLVDRFEVRARDRVAVGIDGGVIEGLRHAPLERLGDVVFQGIRLLVDFAPVVVEPLGEKRLQQPVVTDDL